MPSYDVNHLKNRAQCLKAKTSLEAELDGYQHRDQDAAYRDRQSGRASASTASRLASYTSRTQYLTTELARPDLPDNERERYEEELEMATFQKGRLTRRSAQDGGPAAFLAEVDDDQLDAQVAILTAAIAAVQARHDALPA